MLRLSHIVKEYRAGDTKVEALRDVCLAFRQCEFVSILGPSGCGKTTMLNLIGGLDRYTSGDLFINGISTKEYTDVDWDIYRNTSVGFIFQNYNLISHQTVLSNVELAMTLAGISREERRKRAVKALEEVGLGDQLHKKPNQLSGGQMQRVAIARSLVNNPEILLADEPTGALDSETSLQIMELLKEIAKDRLVIMVTHNAELADRCSTRIIRLLDGRVLSDTDPYASKEQAPEKGPKGKRTKRSMSFGTALSLSLNNLLTKKTRTILTAFAGSIGIIGIALILSLSSGMNAYIRGIETDTLSTYPIEIENQSMDFGGMMSSMMMNNNRRGISHDRSAVYANNITTDLMSTVSMQITRNDLKRFMAYLESDEAGEIRDLSTSIQYGYDLDLPVYQADTSGGLLRVNPSDVYEKLGMSTGGMPMGGGGSSVEIWEELLGNRALLSAQYDVIAGQWPSAYDEIVLVVDENNEISDTVLYSLGLLDVKQLEEIIEKSKKGEPVETVQVARFTYEELLDLRFRLVLQTACFAKDARTGRWVDQSHDEAYMKAAVDSAPELKVVGILRPNASASARTIGGAVAYTAALTEYVIRENEKSEIVRAQREDPKTNVFTGMPFDMQSYATDLTMDDIYALIKAMPEQEQRQIQAMLAERTEEEVRAMLGERIKADAGTASYAENLTRLGVVDYDNPTSIRLYPQNFESKERITALIEAYNATQKDAGHEEYVIHYTDIVGLMISSVTSIIDIISYVLIAFVSISLVVSSIMIGIITYISVLERTKEIGILRSIGASKRDISRVFNAETAIVGFVAGALGIGITVLLNIPVSMIIQSLAGVSNIASLPPYGAVGLVVISIGLTLVAGLIPSRIAAKKDPVEALRTE